MTQLPPSASVLWLILEDGIRRPYLLDLANEVDPTNPELRSDLRIQAAVVLAGQDHRPGWLARQLNLPLEVTRAIVAHIASEAPPGARPICRRDRPGRFAVQPDQH